MIFQLIYTCALKTGCDHTGLKHIAEQSSVRNKEEGITGVLLHKDGSVLQVLEGHQNVVRPLYDRIKLDARVMNPLILIERHVPDREFPRWAMAYKNANHGSDMLDPQIHQYLALIPKNVSPEIRSISRTFARVNRL